MVQISNKPNISGIKDVSEDAEYSSKLLARNHDWFSILFSNWSFILTILRRHEYGTNF